MFSFQINAIDILHTKGKRIADKVIRTSYERLISRLLKTVYPPIATDTY